MSETVLSQTDVPELPEFLRVTLESGKTKVYSVTDNFHVKTDDGVLAIHVYDDPAFDEKKYADYINGRDIAVLRVATDKPDCGTCHHTGP